MLYQTILVIHVMIALALIGLILIQHGKGADAGAAFGSGASGTVFGSQGAASFLTRTTAALATGFFVTSLSLGYIVHQGKAPVSVVDSVPAAIESVTPAAPMPEDTAPMPEDTVATPAAVTPAAPSDVPLPE